MNLRRVILLVILAVGAMVTLGMFVVLADWGPQPQSALKTDHIYAYRGWQSTGVQLSKGDGYAIRAEGSWLYSPYAGPNGPEGHRRFSAPSFYPLPQLPGGALIGRIGEEGSPFYVGKKASGVAEYNGLLYLRIDDDRLGDNEGYVTIEVRVAPPEK